MDEFLLLLTSVVVATGSAAPLVFCVIFGILTVICFIRGIIYKIVMKESLLKMPFHEIAIISVVATMILALAWVVYLMVIFTSHSG